MFFRDGAELPEGGLQALAEGLEALRVADLDMFPVAVGQDEVVQEVLEKLSPDGDFKIAHVGKVGGGQNARIVDLREEHLLGGPLQRSPLFDPPLQRS